MKSSKYSWFPTKCCYCGKNIEVKIREDLVDSNPDLLKGNACFSCIPKNSRSRNGIDESAYETREVDNSPLKMIILSSTEDWLKARCLIGGSDASAVLGVNPYKTNDQLWLEKTGQVVPEDISEKTYVKYGHQAEPLLRQMFQLDFPEYKVMYEENNIWLNDDLPFAHASLDGWLEEQETVSSYDDDGNLIDTETRPTGRKGILEIKTTNILQSMQKEKWNGRIPDNYYIQVLHYLMVTGWDFAVLKAQLKFDYGGDISCQIRHYHIERSEVEEDIKMLEKAERTFWKHVVDGTRPPLLLPEI